MKTLLFLPLYLDGQQRYDRNIKWLEYTWKLKETLNFDEIYYVDNASDKQYLDKFKDYIVKNNIKAIIEECKVHLKRNGQHGYGFWYAAFAKAARFASTFQYNKIIHIDSDCYLLDDKICQYINNINDGWTGFWCEKFQFPETALQVIVGKENIKNMHEFMTRDFLEFYPVDAVENRIPFTYVEKNFKGDRTGESSNKEQTAIMSYYCQAENDFNPIFNLRQIND